MRLTDEIEQLIASWRPTLGNPEDIDIWQRVNMPLGKFKDLKKEQKFLKELLEKRLKDGAIKPSCVIK